MLNGRALTTTGSLTSTAIVANRTGSCQNIATGIGSAGSGNKPEVAVIYPNPFSSSLSLALAEGLPFRACQLVIANSLGAEVVKATLTKQVSFIETSELPPGIYFYRIMSGNNMLKSGKLISTR
jgi:hypothetical protein